MRKTIVYLSLVVLSVCLVPLLTPGSPLELVGINRPVAWLGFAVACSGMIFEWEWLHALHLRFLFHFLSLMILGITVAGLISPSYDGLLTSYIHLADAFVGIESCIILWLLGSEQRRSSVPLFVYLGFAAELFLGSLNRQRELLFGTRRTHRHA